MTLYKLPCDHKGLDDTSLLRINESSTGENLIGQVVTTIMGRCTKCQTIVAYKTDKRFLR